MTSTWGRDLLPEADWIELGDDVAVTFTSWGDLDKSGLIHSHHRPDDGEPCAGGIMFDLPGVAEAFPNRPLWTLVSVDPLTVSPSLLCSCGSHGFIQDGKWVTC